MDGEVEVDGSVLEDARQVGEGFRLRAGPDSTVSEYESGEGGEPEVKTKVPRTDGGGPANKRRVVYSGRVGRNGVGNEICCVPNYTLFSSH